MSCAFADYRIRDRFPRRRGFQFRGSGDKNSVELCRSRIPGRILTVVGRVARFCFARRISSRDGGYEIATPLDRTRAPARRISGRLLFCLSAPLLSGPLR